MTTYHVYFRGGSKNGQTGDPYTADEPQGGIHFDGVYLDANEWYFLTNETITINGVEHLVYELKA